MACRPLNPHGWIKLLEKSSAHLTPIWDFKHGTHLLGLVALLMLVKYKSPQGGILLRRLRGVNIICYADILEHVQTANCRIGEPGSQWLKSDGHPIGTGIVFCPLIQRMRPQWVTVLFESTLVFHSNQMQCGQWGHDGNKNQYLAWQKNGRNQILLLLTATTKSRTVVFFQIRRHPLLHGGEGGMFELRMSETNTYVAQLKSCQLLCSWEFAGTVVAHSRQTTGSSVECSSRSWPPLMVRRSKASSFMVTMGDCSREKEYPHKRGVGK